MNDQSKFDEIVNLMVSNSLEYNATIITLCTSFWGTLDVPRNRKKFQDQIKKFMESHIERMDKLEKQLNEFKELENAERK